MSRREKLGRNDPCGCGSGKKLKHCCGYQRSPPFRRTPEYLTLKGKTAEQMIHQFAERTFLSDWCYPNPILPDGKELCDLLVVFDDTAIVWQIKDVQPDKEGFMKDSDLEKNLRQLGGARRQLFDLQTKIELQNPRRGREIFDTTSIKNIHLISVILTSPEKLAFQPLRFLECVKGHVAHVFVSAFTELIMNELDTITDFCAYLRALEDIAIKAKIILAGREEDFLAHYLSNGRDLRWLNLDSWNLVHEGAWETFVSGASYRKEKEECEISYLWDQLIDSAHEGAHQQPLYEKVARELARSSRTHRRVLANVFLEAHQLAHEASKSQNVFRRVISFNGMTYCFLFMHDPVNEQVPIKLLEASCFVARGTFPESSKVVGIATGMRLDRPQRLHFGLLEVLEWSKEHQERMKVFQRDLGILLNPEMMSRDM